MKKLFSVLKYTRDYKSYTFLNIFFNVLFALFSAATLALVGPFSELLFKTGNADLLAAVANGPPQFASTPSYFQKLPSYYLSSLILVKGKTYTLIVICVTVL